MGKFFVTFFQDAANVGKGSRENSLVTSLITLVLIWKNGSLEMVNNTNFLLQKR